MTEIVLEGGSVHPCAMPEWLAPYKNDWRSAAKLGEVLQLSDRSLGGWVNTVKGRFRCVESDSQNGKNPTRKYLVKSVWAVARAHGLTVVSGHLTTPPPDLACVRIQNASLTRRLAEANSDRGNARELSAQLATAIQQRDDASFLLGGNSTSLMRLLLQTTEPRARPGVYFLLNDHGQVCYVGQSKNVIGRMAGHVNKEFVSSRMIEEPDLESRLKIESIFIRRMEPCYNLIGNGH